MKKAVWILISLCLVVCLSSCGSPDENVSGETANSTQTTTDPENNAGAVESEQQEPEPVAVSAIELSETELELQINDEVKLSAAITPEDAEDKNITWVSSDAAVVSVVNGTVYALAEGNVVITATASNGVAAVCKVKVVQPSAYDQLNEDEKKLFDAFVSNISEFTDPSLVKFKSVKYHSWDLYDFEFFAALSVAGQNKSFGFTHGGSAFFKAGLDIPTDECFDIGRLNAALQEYCNAQGW